MKASLSLVMSLPMPLGKVTSLSAVSGLRIPPLSRKGPRGAPCWTV